MPIRRTPDDQFIERGLVTATVNIGTSNSISTTPLRLEGRGMMMIFTPSGMAGSRFSFLAVDPRGTRANVYDDAGNEVLVEYASERAVGVDITGALAAGRELYLRSGPAGSANNQDGNMIIGLTLKA